MDKRDDPEARIRELERPLSEMAVTFGDGGVLAGLALADVVQIGVNEDTIAQCPNGNRPPTTWYTEAAPTVPAGTLFCGNYNDGPDLLWTHTSDLLQGDIQGPDLNALLTTAAK